MDISIGAEVVGTDGKLGEVHRVIVDARSNHVTDLVVKHGFVFGNERLVPLGLVDKVEDGVVHVRLDRAGFEAMNGYSDDRYHAPDPNYVGPPGFDNTHFMLDTVVAFGSGGGSGSPSGASPPLGYPGGEPISPEDMQRPMYHPGTPIHDVNGEKVGEVDQLKFDPESGAPTHIIMRRGYLFHHDAELPLTWVSEMGDKGIQLNVPRAQLETQLRPATQ